MQGAPAFCYQVGFSCSFICVRVAACTLRCCVWVAQSSVGFPLLEVSLLLVRKQLGDWSVTFSFLSFCSFPISRVFYAEPIYKRPSNFWPVKLRLLSVRGKIIVERIEVVLLNMLRVAGFLEPRHFMNTTASVRCVDKCKSASGKYKHGSCYGAREGDIRSTVPNSLNVLVTRSFRLPSRPSSTLSRFVVVFGDKDKRRIQIQGPPNNTGLS